MAISSEAPGGDSPPSTGAAAGSAAAAVDRVASRTHRAVDEAASAAHAMAEKVARKRDEAAQMADDAFAEVRNYAREKPLAAIGIAFAIGFVLSRLTR